MIEKAEDAIVILMRFSMKVLLILLVILFIGAFLNLGIANSQSEEDEEEVEEAMDEEDDEDEEDEEGEEEAVEAPLKLTGELAFGQTVYMKRCFHCHGVKGRGDGFSAERLNPRPANFARAQYKYASTIKEALPTDEDLFTTVSKGLPGTGMPAWEKVLSEEERRAVIQFIKTFSDKFSKQNGPPKKIDFGTRISSSDESIAKGKELFLQKECNRCHGLEGRADGANAAELKVWPRNFTKGWTFRRTNAPEEIFQRITRGIWVMPSFAEGENVSTTIEERWHIANYVNSLGPSVQPSIDAVIRSRPVEGGVPSDPNDPRWEEVRQYYYPLVGQVTQEPRMFTPTVDTVYVKAVHDEKDISILVIWDDPTHNVGEGIASVESDSDVVSLVGDAVAVQLPIRMPKGSERPYFIMGDADYPVTLARWNASSERLESFEAKGQGNIVLQKDRPFTAKGVFKNGQYRAVFKRPLATEQTEANLQMAVGTFIPISFTAWDAENGERDGLRSISAWYYILMEVPKSSTVYIYPTIIAFVVVGAEMWIIWKRRKGQNGSAR